MSRFVFFKEGSGYSEGIWINTDTIAYVYASSPDYTQVVLNYTESQYIGTAKSQYDEPSHGTQQHNAFHIPVRRPIHEVMLLITAADSTTGDN